MQLLTIERENDCQTEMVFFLRPWYLTYLYERRSDAILLKRFSPVSERKEESSWGKNVMVMIDFGQRIAWHEALAQCNSFSDQGNSSIVLSIQTHSVFVTLCTQVGDALP